ncbi:unnamed protein product [Prunus brigantina]
MGGARDRASGLVCFASVNMHSYVGFNFFPPPILILLPNFLVACLQLEPKKKLPGCCGPLCLLFSRIKASKEKTKARRHRTLLQHKRGTYPTTCLPGHQQRVLARLGLNLPSPPIKIMPAHQQALGTSKARSSGARLGLNPPSPPSKIMPAHQQALGTSKVINSAG